MKGLAPYRPLFTGGMKTWSPFTFENRIRRFFGPELFPELLEEPFAWTPEIDLVDVNGEFILTAELPGMKLEDVEIEVVDNVLMLKGEKKQFEQWKEANLKVAERNYGMFERSFTLPLAVVVDKIHAEFQNGVLTVHLPKTEEARGRRIKIEAK
jgi:HSP20 family protein